MSSLKAPWSISVPGMAPVCFMEREGREQELNECVSWNAGSFMECGPEYWKCEGESAATERVCFMECGEFHGMRGP
eukprot:2486000-Rhodomonas_salina.1